jgi:aerobic C4-dicarboxylate transport protein
MGEGMAVTNTIGNAVAALVIGRWTGRLDEARMSATLSAKPPVRTSGLRSGHVAEAQQALGPEA